VRVPVSTKLHALPALVIVTSLLVPAPAKARDTVRPRGAAETPAAEVDKLFSPWDKPNSPGCLVGIIKDGAIVYKRGYGMANLDYDIPISPKSVFPIASLSKQFTAACIALMSDDGTISLEDDVRRYLPEMPDYGRPVKVRHLIYHTSGIRDYGNELLPLTGSHEGALSDGDVLGLLARQKGLHFSPGEAYRYSNSGYFLLGMIVKRVTGKSLRAYAHERIFKPLGMGNTHFHDDPTQVVKNRVVGYSWGGEGAFQMKAANINGAGGDGGVMTTLKDLFLWDLASYEGGLGKAGFFGRLLTPGKLNSGERTGYAFGLNLGEYRGLKTVWHTGAFPGFRTAYVRFPGRRFSVIILANLGGPKGLDANQLAYRVADIYLAQALSAQGRRPEPKPAPTFVKLPGKDLEDKKRAFLDPDGTPWVFSAKGGTLQVTYGVFAPRAIRTGALSATRFQSVADPFRFELEFPDPRKDGPGVIRVHPEGGKPFPLKRARLVSPTQEELREYVGAYFSEELQTTYRIAPRDGRLVLVCRNTPDSPLGPTVRDAFKARRRNNRNLQLTFVRDSKDRVCALLLSKAGGVRDIRFIRKAD
jgi:CubicO group peptidase (beta-lactamase class C family)